MKNSSKRYGGLAQLRLLILLQKRGEMAAADFHHVGTFSRGTIYPTLKRLERAKLVTCRAEVSPRVAGPPRIFYQITERGQHAANLDREFVERVLRGE